MKTSYSRKLYKFTIAIVAITTLFCVRCSDNGVFDREMSDFVNRHNLNPLDPSLSLEQKLLWLQKYAVSDTEYHFEIIGNESLSPQVLSYPGKNNVTIKLTGSGGERTISLKGYGSLFSIGTGAILVLDNGITLRGHRENDKSLVCVSSEGTLIINTGAKITGNTNILNTYNYSSNGGGVYVEEDGVFSMFGGEISGNIVHNGVGGGVYMSGGIFTMIGGKISENIAGFYGGSNGCGVSVHSGSFFLKNGEISDNSGCGVSANGIFEMDGGKIFNNAGDGVSGVFTMNGGEIFGNNGGGVSGTFTMNGGKIFGHDFYGVRVWGTFTMNNGEISKNRYGVLVDGSFTMTGGEIFENTGTGVIVAFFNRDVTFTMDGGKISGNGGGGVSSSGVMTMAGGEISGNGGGGVSSSGVMTMVGGEISGNTASYGGGICNYYEGIFTMTGGKIFENTAHQIGGGVFNSGGTFTMTGGKFFENTAQSGGGIGNSGTFMMADGEIYRNTAFSGGGVFNGNGGNFIMAGGKIFTNTADVDGGGVYAVWGENNYNFTKTGGTIYGYTVGDINSNIVKDSEGVVQDNKGHAVYAYFYDKDANNGWGDLRPRLRETTAGPTINLDSTLDGSSGGWE